MILIVIHKFTGPITIITLLLIIYIIKGGQHEL